MEKALERTASIKGWKNNGLYQLAREGSFLQRFFDKTGDQLDIPRLDMKKVGRRTIFDVDMLLDAGKPVDITHCPGLRINVGALATAWDLYKGKHRVTMRLSHNPDSGKTVAALQGDLSVLLPRVGLIQVGTLPQLSRPSFPVVAGANKFKLKPDASAIFGSKVETRIPLGRSLLVFDGLTDRLRVTPAIDMRGRIFRIGNTGVLVGFESLSITCSGTKPRLDFHGGRIWQKADA
jgi:hypothetical protein